MPKRFFQTIRSLLALVFLIGCVVGGVPGLASPLVWAAEESVGLVTNVIGDFRVYRTDGQEKPLAGKGVLPLFESETVQTGVGSQALFELTIEGEGHSAGSIPDTTFHGKPGMDIYLEEPERRTIQVAMNESTEILIQSRWEKGKDITRILRLMKGEIWVLADKGPTLLEVETPVATVAITGTEFNLHVAPDGQTSLTVLEGMVAFGTAFNSWDVPAAMKSEASRGTRCRKPQPVDVRSVTAWSDAVRP
jgi:hypothetical protein